MIASTSFAQKKNELQVVEEVTMRQISMHPVYIQETVEIKAILPDGSHALLFCNVNDNKCGAVQSLPPEKLPPMEQACRESSAQDIQVHKCTFHDVGVFQFKRSGNRVTILNRYGKSTLSIQSSW